MTTDDLAMPAVDGEGESPMRFALVALAYGAPILFILVPLILFLLQSFFHVEDGRIVHVLTLRNYIRFFSDPVFIPILLYTCLLSLGAAAITVVLGYPVALLPRQHDRPDQIRADAGIRHPAADELHHQDLRHPQPARRQRLPEPHPDLLGVIDHPITFLIFNLYAVMLTLSLILLPFTMLPIFITIDKIPRHLIDASYDLGATSLQTFVRVMLPLSLKGTMVGASFTFMLALGDFVTPQMVGGMNGLTFGRIIYSQFGFAFNWPFGSALSVILLVLVAIVLIVTGWLFGRGTRPA